MSEPLTGERVSTPVRWSDWVGGVSVALTIVLLPASSILNRYLPLGSNLAFAIGLVALIPCLVLTIWWAFDRREWDEKTARRWSDEAQRERRLTMWWAICFSTLVAYQQATFERPFSWLGTLFTGLCLALIAFQTVGAWTLGKRFYATLGDDELTASLRGRAIKVGYVVLFLGVAVGYPLSLRWPGATRAVFIAVLWLGLTVPALTLMWLESRPEQDG